MNNKELSRSATLHLFAMDVVKEVTKHFNSKVIFHGVNKFEKVCSYITNSDEFSIGIVIIFHDAEATKDDLQSEEVRIKEKFSNVDLFILYCKVDSNTVITDDWSLTKDFIVSSTSKYLNEKQFILLKIRKGFEVNCTPMCIVVKGHLDDILKRIELGRSDPTLILSGYVNYSKEKGPSIPRCIYLTNRENFVIDVMGPVDERWENLNLNFPLA